MNHMSHSKRLSHSWIDALWTFKFSFWVNAFSHMSHSKSFSSSWTDAIWAFKLSFWVNLDSHKSHSKDFSCSWFKWKYLHDLFSSFIVLFLVYFWGIIKDFFCSWTLVNTRKYPLRGYILGVLTHTTACDRLWLISSLTCLLKLWPCGFKIEYTFLGFA